jgi:peptide/nickel transport system permease protein
VISEKEKLHIHAASAIGCSQVRIYIRHIVPNIIAIVLVLSATRIPSLVLAEAALSFLGFGVPPPFPSWGGMLSGTARDFVLMAPHLVIWPGVALSILVFSANMFGDAVRDLLDPRLRGGIGRYGAQAVKDQKGDIVAVK